MIRRAAMLCCALVVALTACHSDGIATPSGTFTVGATEHTLIVGELARHYILRVPTRRPVTQAGVVRGYGVVLVMHGSSGSAADMEVTTRFDSLGETNRYIIVYAEGYRAGGGLFPTDWNAGECCGASAREDIDDLGYIAKVVTELRSKLPIDSTRVYAAGFSDGGRMAYYLACKMSGTFAAIAVVSANITDASCHPAKPVPLLAIHGTDDDEISYSTESLTTPPSVVAAASDLPESVQFWAATNSCKGRTNTQPTMHVSKATLTGCTGGDVQFFRIDGGVHAWPNDVDGVGALMPMAELNASAEINAFFLPRVRR